jgi:hypothetical protein
MPATTGPVLFPNECATGPASPQDKLYERLLFDLNSCLP